MNPRVDLKKLSLEAFKFDPVSRQFVDALGCGTMPDAFSTRVWMARTWHLSQIVEDLAVARTFIK